MGLSLYMPDAVQRVVMAVQVREVGDGNINYVYIVEGPSGGVVVKQGLPYIRIAHDWPLTQVGPASLLAIHDDVGKKNTAEIGGGYLLSQAAARASAERTSPQQKSACCR